MLEKSYVREKLCQISNFKFDIVNIFPCAPSVSFVPAVVNLSPFTCN
jgi:hypothetical protein